MRTTSSQAPSARRATLAASPMLRADVDAQQGDDAGELWRFLQVDIARTRKADRHIGDDARGAQPHYDHAVGEKHRLADAVGDEKPGLVVPLPDVEERDVELVARDGVEGAEGL